MSDVDLSLLETTRGQLETRRAEVTAELHYIQKVLDALDRLGQPPMSITRRQALQQIIAEYNGEPFDSRELRKRLVERYPQANTKALPQSVANLLRDMTDNKGELKRLGRRGSGPQDPLIYQQQFRDSG